MLGPILIHKTYQVSEKGDWTRMISPLKVVSRTLETSSSLRAARQRRPRAVLRKLLAHLQIRFLDDIGRIHSLLQAAVEA